MAFQSPITIHRAIRRIESREYVLPVSGDSGVDLLLIRLREVIKEHGNNGFPVNKIEEEMSRPGKNLTFSQEELQDLAESKNYEFALLATLYPPLNIQGYRFHIDHTFPKNRFTWLKLKKAGVPEEGISQFQDRAWQLPNYQPLTEEENEQKGAILPAEWFSNKETGKASEYRCLYDFGEVPADITDFYKSRRDRLLSKLEELLGTKMDAHINT